ncbi:MAG: hypothetical protein ABIR81_01110 [Ginsengibacter sp.]
MRSYIAGLFKTVFIVGMLSFVMSACSKKMMFQSSTVVPAAEGSIKYKKDKNNNYKIDINVVHLANSDKLTPARSTYVVWMETKNSGVKNLGQLKSSSSLLSSALKGSLNAVSSFEPQGFFITAEDDANISYPGTQVVLRAN